MRDNNFFNLDFFKTDKDDKSENQVKIRQELAGINNICYSLEGFSNETVEVDSIHIYASDQGFYNHHLDFLTKALYLLGIDFEFHKLNDVDSLPYGDLPLLRIENMFFTKEYFLEVILKLISINDDEIEELANRHVLNILEELGKVLVDTVKNVDPRNIICLSITRSFIDTGIDIGLFSVPLKRPINSGGSKELAINSQKKELRIQFMYRILDKIKARLLKMEEKFSKD